MKSEKHFCFERNCIIRKMFFLMIVILTCTSLINACTKKEDTPLVSLTINTDEITTATEKIEFAITNRGTVPFEYMPSYRIEKQTDSSSWTALAYADTFPGYQEVEISRPFGESHYILPVLKWYGNLSVGHYRIVLESSNPNKPQMLSAEFTVVE